MKNEKIKKAISKVVEEIIDWDMYEWPPGCAYILYQPERPETINNEENKLSSQI